MDMKKTGNLIRTIRSEKEMTQKELAELLHVSNAAVSKWENGHGFPEISLLEPLAEALGISVTELMRGERLAEEEEAEQDVVIKDIICLSEKEKKRKANKQMLILIIGVITFALLGGFGMWYLWKYQNTPVLVFSQSSGALLLFAIFMGLSAWVLPVISIKRSIAKKKNRASLYAAFSFACCAIANWIPVFMIDLKNREGDVSAIMDTAWGYNMAVMQLLLVTIILNIAAFIVYLMKKTLPVESA